MRADGGEVELLPDDERPGGWLLLLDRIRQSFVNLHDPTDLEFPYMQMMAEIISALPPGPLDAVHLGGGGATLPRWLAAVRPHSAQTVFEPHAELLRIVRTRLAIPPAADIEFRLADGRAGVADLPAAAADLVVVDAFSGGRVPGELGTVEFFTDVRRVLRDSGMLLMNTTGTASSVYLRRLVAAIATQFPEVVVHGDYDGAVTNLVIAAAGEDCLPVATIVAEDGPMGPPLALSGSALHAFVDGEKPLIDGFTMRSPVPPDETWRVGED